ncbi:unnamed protein product [[Candida] boidinii]|nr:unnamed protein product [[Candida] boidinii]
MIHKILILCTILLGLLPIFNNASPIDIYSSEDERPYVVLMKKPKSVEKLLMQKDFRASNSQLRQKITSFYSFGDFEGFSGVFNRYTLRGFWRNSLVEDIVPDSTFKAVDIDIQTEASSHLVRLTQPGPVFQEKDQRNYYFDNTTLGLNTIVYVIDTGVFIEHPEFEGRAVNGPNFSTDKENKDTVGHGTHVAGIIGAKTYGVAKQATIVSIKVLDKNGSGTLSSIITGLQYAVNHRNGLGEDIPAVVNLSLGAPKSAVVNRAIKAASNSGLFVVAAAGNNNANACSISPASSEFSFTVGAINDRTDRMASFTNWGKCVDIFAPGEHQCPALLLLELLVSYSAKM